MENRRKLSGRYSTEYSYLIVTLLSPSFLSRRGTRPGIIPYTDAVPVLESLCTAATRTTAPACDATAGRAAVLNRPGCVKVRVSAVRATFAAPLDSVASEPNRDFSDSRCHFRSSRLILFRNTVSSAGFLSRSSTRDIAAVELGNRLSFASET